MSASDMTARCPYRSHHIAIELGTEWLTSQIVLKPFSSLHAHTSWTNRNLYAFSWREQTVRLSMGKDCSTLSVRSRRRWRRCQNTQGKQGTERTAPLFRHFWNKYKTQIPEMRDNTVWLGACVVLHLIHMWMLVRWLDQQQQHGTLSHHCTPYYSHKSRTLILKWKIMCVSAVLVWIDFWNQTQKKNLVLLAIAFLCSTRAHQFVWTPPLPAPPRPQPPYHNVRWRKQR